mmetsp:Transcript_33133/g.97737  ORF Transcript_33133/g.97737 Transcript_33133/m.97737 type:complete len:178 (-) Transcript_33133:65-598(-)
MERRSADEVGRSKPLASAQERLGDLRKQFLESLKGDLRHPNGCFIDCGKGKHCACSHKIIRVQDANASSALLDGFRRGNYRKRYTMPMGLMFHGTAKHSISSICRNGMHDASHYTNSFHYAACRSNYKANYYLDTVEVLVLAVLVDGNYRLKQFDTTLNCKSDREYTLPLFIVTVKA